mgnify:CR=1 FL=1
MKVNGEIFLERFNQYKIKETAILVSGNELSLITKIESLIIKGLAGNFVNKKVIFDFKTNKNINFINLINSKSLFVDHNIIQIINPDDSLIKSLENNNINNNTIIINGENVKNNSKIKKYFDLHKKFYSIVCYKLTNKFKKELIDKFISEQKSKLTKDAYWFLVENLSNEYQLLENELNKINSYNNKTISIKEIKELSTNYNQIQLDDLFFQCFISSNDIILRNSNRAINSSVDAYSFLQTVKKFANILTITSEQKNEKSLSILVDNYLPKYLFKQRDSFATIINKADINKITIINNLILKTELFLRKNNIDYLIIIQRFMLNCAKALK